MEPGSQILAQSHRKQAVAVWRESCCLNLVLTLLPTLLAMARDLRDVRSRIMNTLMSGVLLAAALVVAPLAQFVTT